MICHERRRALASRALHVFGQRPHGGIAQMLLVLVARLPTCCTAGTSKMLRTDQGYRDGHGVREGDSELAVDCVCAIHATHRMQHRRQLGPPEGVPVGNAHAWMRSLLGPLDKAWTSTLSVLPSFLEGT